MQKKKQDVILQGISEAVSAEYFGLITYECLDTQEFKIFTRTFPRIVADIPICSYIAHTLS